MIERVKSIAVIILCLTLAACAGLLTWRLSGTLREVRDTAAVMHGAADDLSVAVKEQIDIFRSPAYQQSYKHSAELGDIAAKTVAQIARQTIPRLNKAVDELTAVAVSVREVSDEARLQVKQNGDATARAVGTLDLSLTNLTAHVTKVLDDGSLMIETMNPKLQATLDHLDTVIVTANGAIEAYQPVGVNLAGITSDFNAMTSDSQAKLHEILFPAPKHGWARAGQVATYLLRPVWDGLRIYYSLTALPVRLTEPIPLLRKP